MIGCARRTLLPSLPQTIHFIDVSPFGYVSNGRDNWLFNIAKRLSLHCEVYIHCAKPVNRQEVYDISKLRMVGVKIIRYGFADNNRIFSRALNKLSYRIFYHVLSLFFAIRVFVSLWVTIKQGTIIFSMNPWFEEIPGLLLHRLNRGVSNVCLMKGKPAYESTNATPFLKRFFFALEKHFVTHAQYLFSNATDTKEYIISRYGRVTGIIKNGVDVGRFRLPENQPMNDGKTMFENLKNGGAKIIVFVGTLNWRKGIEFILNLPHYLDKVYHEKYVIVLIGKGRPDIYFKSLDDSRIHKIFYFLGEQRDIPFFYHRADVSLHLTYSQTGMGGTSHATLEALGSGCPVVAWDNRTYNQFLTSGQDAMLVPEGEMEALAGAVRDIIANEELSATLSNNGMKTAQLYDWEIVTRELLAIIDDLHKDKMTYEN